jgi:hypothetical protein
MDQSADLAFYVTSHVRQRRAGNALSGPVRITSGVVDPALLDLPGVDAG